MFEQWIYRAATPVDHSRQPQHQRHRVFFNVVADKCIYYNKSRIFGQKIKKWHKWFYCVCASRRWGKEEGLERSQDLRHIHTHRHTRCTCRDDPQGRWRGSRLEGSQQHDPGYWDKYGETHRHTHAHKNTNGGEAARAKRTRYAGALLISRERERDGGRESSRWPVSRVEEVVWSHFQENGLGETADFETSAKQANTPVVSER